MLQYWGEYSSPELAEMEKEHAIVVMVVGSCEQHARHLPLNTDTILGEAIAESAAQEAKIPVILLPAMPYGFSRHHLKFPGSLSLDQNQLSAIIQTIFTTVSSYGFKNLAVINSHGGNSAALHTALNELGAINGIKLISVKYWDLAADFIKNHWRESPLGGIGHAGEMETALMMHVAPQLIREDQIGGYASPDGGNAWFHADMFANNSIVMYNDFSVYSPDGNVGMAQYATPEKGKILFEYCCHRMAEFFDEFWNENKYI